MAVFCDDVIPCWLQIKTPRCLVRDGEFCEGRYCVFGSDCPIEVEDEGPSGWGFAWMGCHAEKRLRADDIKIDIFQDVNDWSKFGHGHGHGGTFWWNLLEETAQLNPFRAHPRKTYIPCAQL